jgi:mycothiol synthase
MNTTPDPTTNPGSPTRPASAAFSDQALPGVSSGALSPAQRDEVLRLIGAATASDAVAPLSEHVMLHLRYDGTAGLDLTTAMAGHVAGYAYLEVDDAGLASGELVVDPAHRRHGAGRALLGVMAAQAGDRPLRVWAHGDLPAAAALAQAAGLHRVRALWQMRRSLRDPLPEPLVPPDVTLRTFVPGTDEDEWLRLNAAAFAHHPEQGAWTRADLDMREREDWFDPAGFFLAERSGRLVGFHWTKVHDAVTGEVYVVGVDPAAHGGGLGRALTVTGLRYLRDVRSLTEVMLYVDESNRAAVRMYEKLGFTCSTTDVMYGTG